MRILVVTPWFPVEPGDQSGNFILAPVQALCNLGHEVSVLVTQPWRPKVAARLHYDWRVQDIDHNSFDGRFQSQTIRHISFPRDFWRSLSNGFYIGRVAPRVRQLIHERKIDVIHAHTEMAGVAAIRGAASTNVPVVVTLHGVSQSPKLQSARNRRFLGEGLKDAASVLFVGEPLIAHFSWLPGPAKKYRVLHNGFVLKGGYVRRNAVGSRPVLHIISVSNLHEGKGIEINLRALAKLNHLGILDWHYEIIGEGRERSSLETLTRELGLAGQVKFKGAVRWADVGNHLVEADIFSLPSYREAFGIAYLEAMACGLLAIAVRGQGPEAFIEHGETGYLVDSKDPDDLCDVLRRAFMDRGELQRIAAAGAARATADFSWEQHGKRLAQVFEEVLP